MNHPLLDRDAFLARLRAEGELRYHDRVWM
jgi:hypothetical protein